ncbi:MAG: prefoldin subunit alpha [Nanoarchaeota archaeon]|nr:prefoldin subunit alpha [Nanoarchaeota archaeon]
MQFQTLQQQMQQIVEHIELLQQQNMELDISQNALQELAKTELNTEILAPIADGIFFKGNLKDNQKLIVNVGSNTTVEKTIPETIQLLQKHQQEIIARVSEAEKIVQQMQSQAMKIYEDIEKNVQQA